MKKTLYGLNTSAWDAPSTVSILCHHDEDKSRKPILDAKKKLNSRSPMNRMSFLGISMVIFPVTIINHNKR